MEATRSWRALEPRINEYLGEIEKVVRHVNDITSYSMANLQRQVKNLQLRHATVLGPEEFSKFPIHMVSRPQNKDFYGRSEELERIDHYLNPKDSKNLLRTYSKYPLATELLPETMVSIRSFLLIITLQQLSMAGEEWERLILLYNTPI